MKRCGLSLASLIGLLAVSAAACRAPAPPAASPVAQSVLLITIDTLRADAVGAYGSATSTPTLDALARDGARVDRAWTTAPITLTAHASLLTGQYPPRHGARHNGVAIGSTVPTLAESLKRDGFATAAFVSAFPLDHRFGLTRGFDVYNDDTPRGADGRPLNERPGADTVSAAIEWLSAHRSGRFFLWVHLFEPHAPYGHPGDAGDAQHRYASEVTVADREAGRLIAALGDASSSTLIVASADHGEAFGEHDEIGHSIFVYDTTLRIPLLLRGPGVPAGVVIKGDASIIDIAPTITALTRTTAMAGDGRSLTDAFSTPIEPRALYAESFAPLYDFGWASLRAIREGGWKYIAAPKPELYQLADDPAERVNRVDQDRARAAASLELASRWSGAEPARVDAGSPTVTPEAAARLRSLGYASGGASAGRPAATRPDPKDRIAVASQLSLVTSGEVTGERLISTLESILKADPQNPQAHLRLGYAQIEREQCDRAEPHLRAALTAGIPSADAGLGLAQCLLQKGNVAAATSALEAALRAEPGNPVVQANLGLISLQTRDFAAAVSRLRSALQADPSLLEARFGLARALANAGDRDGALSEATTLLRQLGPDAPQRAEVQRLINALQ